MSPNPYEPPRTASPASRFSILPVIGGGLSLLIGVLTTAMALFAWYVYFEGKSNESEQIANLRTFATGFTYAAMLVWNVIGAAWYLAWRRRGRRLHSTTHELTHSNQHQD